MTSSTGLSERGASALAYVAGPVSGALLLFIETESQPVRFHAWQSVYVFGTLSLLLALLYAGTIGSVFISARLVTILIVTASWMWGAIAAVWLGCLWKAGHGERFHLPVAGAAAERRVG
jgi:uncharacterized membrane protein